MRLVQFTDEISLQGGKSPYLRRISKKLLTLGWETFFLTYNRGDTDLPHARVIHAGSYKDVEKEIKQFEPDLINTHCMIDDESWEYVAAYPVVRTIHNHNPYCPSGTKYNARHRLPCDHKAHYCGCLKGYLVNGCGSRRPWRIINNFVTYKREKQQLHNIPLIALSEYHRNELISAGYKPELVFTNHVFGPDPGDVGEQPPIKGERPYFIFPGRVVPYKGIDWLVDALLISKEKPLLVIAGDGYYLPEVKARVSKLALDDYVIFKGWLGQQDLRWWIKHARAVVVPSAWHEPAGSVAAETMRLGTPLIISRVGGLKEFFMFGDGGLMVSPGDVQGLADALDKLAANRQLARELGRGAYKMAVEYFNIDRHAQRLVEIFSIFRRKKSTSIRFPEEEGETP